MLLRTTKYILYIPLKLGKIKFFLFSIGGFIKELFTKIQKYNQTVILYIFVYITFVY